jgi:hypothetical protein
MQVNNPAINFKPGIFKQTERKIKSVMQYVVYCYLKMLKDGKTYSFSMKGSQKKEDFLRSGLVNDYLSKKNNKDYYKTIIVQNPAIEIFFSKEELAEYNNDAGKVAEDKIDISVKETVLSNMLAELTNDEIRFAIECKRINNNNDFKEYVKDIQKFTDRPFTTYRLTFEGQIGFIENASLSHQFVASSINLELNKTLSIKTTQHLLSYPIYNTFGASYKSEHKRNFGTNAPFSIIHLLFNYSGIAIP